jgi:hypothetical protein
VPLPGRFATTIDPTKKNSDPRWTGEFNFPPVVANPRKTH